MGSQFTHPDPGGIPADGADTSVLHFHADYVSGGHVIAAQNANKILAGPTSGSAAAPTFRALVSADLPGPDATIALVREDFLAGNNGELPWAAIGSTAPATSLQTGVWPHLGIMQMGCATDGALGYFVPRAGVTNYGEFGSNAGWDSVWIFKLNQVDSAVRFYMGFSQAATGTPTSGIFLNFDGALDASNFRFQTMASSSSTYHATTYTADTNWHKVRIRSTTAGTIGLTFDANSEITQSSNVPTGSLVPQIGIGASSAVEKSYKWDLFILYVQGLAR